MEAYAPTHLLLQWHVTERCNLRCSHCYQDSYARNELSFEQLLGILEQYKSILDTFSQRLNRPVRGHINITGGEPFARQDFVDLLEVFAQHRQLFSFAILSNATFIDRTIAKQLQQLKPRYVQISIEGTEQTHDAIRGEDNFKQTLAGLAQLRKVGIYTVISFTAHRRNYKEFPDVVKIARQHKANRVWSDRLIPHGSGANEFVLTPEETQDFFQLMHDAQQSAQKSWFNRTTEVATHRALQFLISGGKPYHCTAGESFVTIQSNGDVLPCRRMPIVVGNILDTPLLELYDKTHLFQQLRDPNLISEGCEGCFYQKICRGGLKCLSYALKGDPFQADPNCWKAKPTSKKTIKVIPIKGEPV
ncbi:radical SAM protein [Candidatus Albibeggiatoa sp. nov. NOAA]|uniref:radical SAM/SPASM domain-containing protein n=1 Tax=Candidatus Albibeggiatoa sp. nov. NOAA TaxID=3162724 RepID=UPI0032F5DDB9|nr:radical SAM protein [Thiotrichaceae bacterium]